MPREYDVDFASGVENWVHSTIVDQDTFIAQLEEILEAPEPADPQGNCYELYLLLQRLKAGGISFEQFLTQAKAWAEN